ncbi:helix-turn-helix transcriptional regulator [Actinosynnema sp. CS-041913]|uniref:helix-turn-helix transcriptional regulator n=1 Tax=Actinosynnema sp. CS-041913 TaxID=3239917 RepID=UPI003D939486
MAVPPCKPVSTDNGYHGTFPDWAHTTWTREQLAEASGFDRKTTNHIETGRHSPSLGCVFVLADALNVEIIELFTWDTV